MLDLHEVTPFPTTIIGERSSIEFHPQSKETKRGNKT